jgi:hypothetical protein
MVDGGAGVEVLVWANTPMPEVKKKKQNTKVPNFAFIPLTSMYTYYPLSARPQKEKLSDLDRIVTPLETQKS